MCLCFVLAHVEVILQRNNQSLKYIANIIYQIKPIKNTCRSDVIRMIKIYFPTFVQIILTHSTYFIHIYTQYNIFTYGHGDSVSVIVLSHKYLSISFKWQQVIYFILLLDYLAISNRCFFLLFNEMKP